MKKLITVTAVVLSLSLASVSAQEQEAAENRNPLTRLDNVIALSCTFLTSTQVQWAKDGTIGARIRPVGGATLSVKVQNIDTSGGLAEIVSPQKADALVQQYGWNLHVMEASRSGQMRMLTVFGRESTMGKLKAVYSRTDYLPIDLPGFVTDPDAVQYYGECEVTRRP